MQKVSFSFPPDVVREIDGARGSLSRNRFVLDMLTRALREHREQELHRITAEVYGDAEFASGEEALAESFMANSAQGDL